MYGGDPGGVICSAGGRDIAFPLLYRVVQSLSAAELEAIGAAGLEPFEGAVSFTIHGEAHGDERPGTQYRAPVLGLKGDDSGLSLVIRWHPSEAHYEGYQNALGDIACIHDTEDSTTRRGVPLGETCQTGDGIFTLEWRETDPAWPAPLVIYTASAPLPRDHRARLLFGHEEGDWYAAFTPDEIAVPVPDLEPNPWKADG